MSKMYVKDPNGKYRLVDKQEPQQKPITLEKVDIRLRRVEDLIQRRGEVKE